MIESVDPNEKGGGKKKEKNSSSRTPVLDNFSRDLVKLASEGKLDPVVGREREIVRIAQILSRRKKNNPIIIGEPGCGKTAIVEGLAMKIFEGDCPQNLSDKRIVSLDMTSIVAGTKYRGQFEERMKVILDELQDNHDIIVFIDEIHTIIGAGNHLVHWTHPTSSNLHLPEVNYNVLEQPLLMNTVRTLKKTVRWNVDSKK